MDSLQSNGLPNILETPEIILNYLECQTMSSLSPTRLLDAVFEVISTYRNRKILFEIIVTFNIRQTKCYCPAYFLKALRTTTCWWQIRWFNILKSPKLYEEGLLGLHRGLRKAVSFNQFYEFVAKIQPQLKYRLILRTLFDLIDEDNSESIDKREVLRAFLRNQYVRDSQDGISTGFAKSRAIRNGFIAMDTSGDGEVSFEEFVTFALASQAENDAKMASRAPKTNSDGEENPHAAELQTIKEEIQQMSEKWNADEAAVKAKKEEYERSADDLVF